MRGHRTVLFLLMTVCIACNVHAVEWRVGVATVNRLQPSALRSFSYYMQLIQEQIPSIVLDAEDERLLHLRLEKENELSVARSVHEHVDNHGGMLPGDDEIVVPQQTVVKMPVAIAYSDIEVPEALEQSVAHADTIALDYLARSENVDVLCVIVMEPFDEFDRIKIMAYTPCNETLQVIYDKIGTVPIDTHIVQSGALQLLSWIAGTPYGALQVDAEQSQATFSIQENMIPRITLLPVGDYTVASTAFSYDKKTMDVTISEGTITPLYFDLTAQPHEPMLLYSLQGRSSISFNNGYASTLPLILDKSEFPLLFTGEKPGFSTYQGQLRQYERTVTIRFNPSWTDELQLPIIAQREVYTSLGRALLATGAAILVYNIGTSVQLGAFGHAYAPAVLACGAYATVEAFHSLYRLFDYYRKTQYSSR